MDQASIDQAFNTAIQHHQAGRLPQAEQGYRQILAQQINHAGAVQHLGLIAHQVGRNDAAAELLHRAIDLNPGDSHAHGNLGVILKELGRLDEAIAAYRAAIALRPDYCEAHNNLGVALGCKGQWDEAIAAHRRSIALNPKYAHAYSNLGIALKEKGLLDEAITAFRQSVAADPNYPEARNNLGSILLDMKRWDEAIAACQSAVVLRPGYAEAHYNLSNALLAKGQPDEAIAAVRRAIALRPKFFEAFNTLGIALADKAQYGEAIVAYRQAIELRPNSAEAFRNLGVALQESGLFDEAIAAYREAIAIDPNFPEGHKNLSIALRTRGDFKEGWKEYEWRWKCGDYTSPDRNFPRPLWDGRLLDADTTLLLHAEQGLGDTIQLIRYLPMVAERAVKIIIECAGELQRVLQPLAGDYSVIARGVKLPPFDVQCPLMSLPNLFSTVLETIPAQVPYLYADVRMADCWKQRTAGDSSSFKVGLVWAGNKLHKNDHNRSLALSAFAPLGNLPGIRYYSLQKGEQRGQLRNAPPGLNMVDWTEELNDFADTASLIANLDLIISVDTSVVHLAAAMGKPVWVLLPFVPDWRWLLDRDDSPWYPSMRLFRQPSLGDWESVIQKVANALGDSVSEVRAE